MTIYSCGVERRSKTGINLNFYNEESNLSNNWGETSESPFIFLSGGDKENLNTVVSQQVRMHLIVIVRPNSRIWPLQRDAKSVYSLISLLISETFITTILTVFFQYDAVISKLEME